MCVSDRHHCNKASPSVCNLYLQVESTDSGDHARELRSAIDQIAHLAPGLLTQAQMSRVAALIPENSAPGTSSGSRVFFSPADRCYSCSTGVAPSRHCPVQIPAPESLQRACLGTSNSSGMRSSSCNDAPVGTSVAATAGSTASLNRLEGPALSQARGRASVAADPPSPRPRASGKSLHDIAFFSSRVYGNDSRPHLDGCAERRQLDEAELSNRFNGDGSSMPVPSRRQDILVIRREGSDARHR